MKAWVVFLVMWGLWACSGNSGDRGADVTAVEVVEAGGGDAGGNGKDGADGVPADLADTADTGEVPDPIEPGQVLASGDISDPGKAAEVSYADQLVVRLPAEAVDQPAKLVITGGADPEDQPQPWKPLESYEIRLMVGEESVQPAQPVELRFRVYPAQLRQDLPAADQLVIARFDEEVGHWTELPFSLETDPGVSDSPDDDLTWAVVTSYSLCGFSELIVEYPYVAMPVTGWRLLYDPTAQVSLFGVNGITAVVSKYRQILDEAFDGIVAEGFASPRLPPLSWTSVSVYFQQDVGGSEYRWMSGNIVIDTSVGSTDEARHEVAHELMHLFQNSKLTFVGMNNRRWFMEAEADYVAATVMKTAQMGKLIDTSYLRQSLSTVDGSHEYATAVMLKWLVSKGVKLMDLHDVVVASSSTVDDFLKKALEKMLEVGSCKRYVFSTWTEAGGYLPCTEPGDVLVHFAIWLMFDRGIPGEGLLGTYVSPLKGKAATDWAEVKKTFEIGKESLPLLSGAEPGRVVVVTTDIQWLQPPSQRPLFAWRQDSKSCLFTAIQVSSFGANDLSAFGDVAVKTDAEPWLPDFNANNGDVLMLLATNDCADAVELRARAFCQNAINGFDCTDLLGFHHQSGSTCSGNTLTRRIWDCLTPDGKTACYLRETTSECPGTCSQWDAGDGNSAAECKS